jgi:hypothetical protein
MGMWQSSAHTGQRFMKEDTNYIMNPLHKVNKMTRNREGRVRSSVRLSACCISETIKTDFEEIRHWRFQTKCHWVSLILLLTGPK